MLPVATSGRTRSAATAAEILCDAALWSRITSDLTNARRVVLSALCMDESVVCSRLKKVLKKADAEVTVLVDREFYHKRTAPSQRPRLLELQELGATVFLCRGRAGRGHHHKKAIVIDQQTAYVGGANITNSAAWANGEMATRLTGPPVAAVSAALRACQTEAPGIE